jgi:hypothetical protein
MRLSSSSLGGPSEAGGTTVQAAAQHQGGTNAMTALTRALFVSAPLLLPFLSACSADSGDSGSSVTSNSAAPSTGPVALSCDDSAVIASVSGKLADWMDQNMASMISGSRSMLGIAGTVGSDVINNVSAQLVVEISSSLLVGTRNGIPVCDATAYVGFRDAGGAKDQSGSGALPVEYLLAKGPNGPQASFDGDPFPVSFIAKGGLAPLSALPMAMLGEVDHQHHLQQSAQPAQEN